VNSMIYYLIALIGLAGTWNADTLENIESGSVACRIRIDVVDDWCEPILYWGDGMGFPEGRSVLLAVGHFGEGHDLYWTQTIEGYPELCFNTDTHLIMGQWYDIEVFFGPAGTGLLIGGIDQGGDLMWNFGGPNDFVSLNSTGGNLIGIGEGMGARGGWSTLSGEVTDIVVTPEPSMLIMVLLCFPWILNRRKVQI